MTHGYLRGLGAEPVAYGEGMADRVRALASDGDEPLLRSLLLIGSRTSDLSGRKRMSMIEVGGFAIAPALSCSVTAIGRPELRSTSAGAITSVLGLAASSTDSAMRPTTAGAPATAVPTVPGARAVS